MDASFINDGAQQPVSKVSVLARLIPAVVYLIPAFGATLSAFLMMKMMRALEENETAGIEVVLAVLAESIYPVLGSLYLQIFLGIAIFAVLIARMVMQTKTASPAGWFFILSGILCLIPIVVLAEAQSMIIEALIIPTSADISAIGSTVALLLILTMAALPIIFIILLALSVIPFSTKKRPRWSPLIAAVFVEILIITAAVFFQLRLLWLFQAVS
jgi:hypothetical protein